MAAGAQARKTDLASWGAGLLGFALVAVAGTVGLAFAEPLRLELRAAAVVVIATGLLASMLLATIRRAPWTARAAGHLYAALLLTLATRLLPSAVPVWTAPALLVVFVASNEGKRWVAGVASCAGLLAAATASTVDTARLLASTTAFAIFGLAAGFMFDRLHGRLAELRSSLARLRHGAEFADEDLQLGESERRATPPRPGTLPPGTSRFTRVIRSLRAEARAGRDVERAHQLEADLNPLLSVARLATQAHAALLFTIDSTDGTAYLRAALGPDTIERDARLPGGVDPVAFVRDRQKVFYATEFRSLLWSLPYYRGEVRIGSLLAAPVVARGAVAGLLIVDHLETQAFADREEAIVAVAGLAAHVIEADRETLAVEERRIEFEAAATLSQRLAELTEVAEIHEFVARSIRDMAPRTIASGLLRIRGDELEVLPGAEEKFSEWVGTGRKLPERTWLTWHIGTGAESRRLDTWTERPSVPLFRPGGGFPGDSLLVEPLRFRNRLAGVLVAVGERNAFEGPTPRVLGLVANQAAAAIALLDLIETNRSLALHDGLTGMLNRRAFDESIARAVAHALRSGQPVSLAMMDLDRFKSLNDRYGHLVGDRALQLASEEARGQIRAGDLAARYGGEEFALILPNTDGANAFRLAERVRSAIERRPLQIDGEKVSVTASLGVAATDQGYLTEEELIRAADEALYASKQTGRNRSSLAAGVRPR